MSKPRLNGLEDLIGLIKTSPAVELRQKIQDQFGSDSMALINLAKSNDEDFLPALFVAIDRGDLEIPRTLLDMGADIEIKGPNGNTPLMRAYQKRNLPMAELLIERGANMRASSKLGTRVFDLAMICSDLPTIGRFLALGLPLDHKIASGTNTLHRACAGSSVEVLRWILDRSRFRLEDPNLAGMRPIDVAANLEIFQYILQRIPELAPNQTFKNGKQSIHQFAHSGKAAIVDLLLDRGIDVHAPGPDRNTVLHYAVASKNAELVRSLIRRGAGLEARNKHSSRPLHWAVDSGSLETVQALVEAGAKVNVKTSTNFIIREMRTPLFFAVEKGHEEIALFLLEHGAKPDEICDTSHATALTAACGHDRIVLVRALLERGASPNGINSKGHPGIDYHYFPLGSARSAEVVDLLVAKGADIDATNRNQETALHLSLQSDGGHERKFEVLQALLRHGANIQLRDSHGRTALALARHPDAVRLLREADGKASSEAPMSTVQTGREKEQELYRKSVVSLVELIRGEPAPRLPARAELGEQLFDRAHDCQGREALAAFIELLRPASSRDVNWRSRDPYDNDVTILHLVLRAMLRFQDHEDADLPLFVTAVDLLLRLGADVNAIETLSHESPLHKALQAGMHGPLEPVHIEHLQKIAQRLLEAGAEINAENNQGSTPLDFVQSAPLLHDLQKRGARLGSAHHGLFHHIDRDREPEAVQLLDAGIPIETRNVLGDTPLLFAARRDKPRFMSLLAARGGDLEARSADTMDDETPSKGETLSHRAAKYGAQNALEWILERNLDLNVINADGHPPLCGLLAFIADCGNAAKKKDLEQLAIRLVSHGARLDIVGIDGRSPLDFAGTKRLRSELARVMEPTKTPSRA